MKPCWNRTPVYSATSGRSDSNRRSPVPETGALPLGHSPSNWSGCAELDRVHMVPSHGLDRPATPRNPVLKTAAPPHQLLPLFFCLIKLKRDVQLRLQLCDARSLERLAGLEPVVTSLEDSYSTFELQPRILERATGVGPASPRWQRGILPLKYARSIWWKRRELNPRLQCARLPSSHLDDAPHPGTPSKLRAWDLLLVGQPLLTPLS